MRSPILTVLLLLLFPLPAFADQSKCLLRVGWEDWYPMFYERDGQLQGLEYQNVVKLAAAADCQLQFLEVPWKRAMQELKSGRLDMLYGASKSPERAKFAAFSLPYRVERIVLIVRADSSPKKNKVSLQEWLATPVSAERLPVLGLALGYYYGAELERIVRLPTLAAQRIELRWDQKLREMLQFNRIDGFLAEEAVAKAMVSNDPQQYLLLSVAEHKPDPMHLMFSPLINPAIIARFNNEIKTLSVR